jgi:hypothetical protein
MFDSVILLVQQEVEAVVKAKVEVEVEAQITLLNRSGEECPPDKGY